MLKVIILSLMSFSTFAANSTLVDRVIITSNKTDTLQILETLMLNVHNVNGQKFVMTTNNELFISNTGLDTPEHGDLGRGLDVAVAGFIRLKYGFNDEVAIRINNSSGKYCSSYESLGIVRSFLQNLVPGVKISAYHEPKRDKCK